MMTKEDFADQLSQDIFTYRKAFYETGDWKHLLRMSLRSHSDTVAKVNKIADAFYQGLHESEMRIVIFGGGRQREVDVLLPAPSWAEGQGRRLP